MYKGGVQSHTEHKINDKQFKVYHQIERPEYKQVKQTKLKVQAKQISHLIKIFSPAG